MESGSLTEVEESYCLFREILYQGLPDVEVRVERGKEMGICRMCKLSIGGLGI